MMKTVIIGASHGGIAAARSLKQLDQKHDVVLIDQRSENELGFISSGINLFFRGTIDHLKEATTQANAITDLGIKLVTEKKVIEINKTAREIVMYPIEDEEKRITITYDNLIVATGTSPLIAARDYPNIKNILSYKSIKESELVLESIQKAETIAISGTGYIGMELADSLRNSGKKVYLLEGSQEMLFRYFDQEMVQELRKRVNASNIELIPYEIGMDYEIVKNKIKTIRLRNREIPIELLILPDSIYTNVEIVENIITMNIDNTVSEDGSCRTSDPHIFAVGDIVPIVYPHHQTQIFMPLLSRAVRMGRIAAMNICGEEVQGDLVHKISGTVIFGQFLGSAGLTEEEAPLFGFSVGSIQGNFPLQTKFS